MNKNINSIKEEDFIKAINDKKFMEIFNLAEQHGSFTIQLQKYVKLKQYTNNGERLLWLGVKPYDWEEELIVTKEDIDYLFSAVSKDILVHSTDFRFRVYDYYKRERNKELKKVCKDLDSEGKLFDLLSKFKGVNKENSLKRSIDKFIESHKNNAEHKDRIEKLSTLIGEPSWCPAGKIKVLELSIEEVDFLLRWPKDVLGNLEEFPALFWRIQQDKRKQEKMRHKREEKKQEKEQEKELQKELERKEKEAKELERQEKIRQREEAYRLKHEDPNFRTGDQHYTMINKEIETLTQVLMDQKKEIQTTNKDNCYMFTTLDFHLCASHSIETLKRVLNNRIKNYYKESKNSE